MSLIHWWPLNNDTQDRITNTQLTNNGATIVNNGKTGQCYAFNGSTNLTTSYPALNTLGSNPAQFSFAFWIKLNSTWTGWGQVFTIGRNGSSWTDIRIGFDIASDKTGYFTVSDGSSAASYSGPKHVLTVGKWHHVAATFDNKKMKLFIDGQPASTPQATASVLPNLSGDTVIAIGGNSGEKGECDINDVRIYDHALSQAEVKELSKALILHYSFNDGFTTNYCDWRNINNIKTSGWLEAKSYNNEELILTAINGWRCFMWEVNSTLIGKNITFSFDAMVTDRSNAGYIYIQNMDTVGYGASLGDIPLTTTNWKRFTIHANSAAKYIGFNVRGVDNTGKSLTLKVRNVKIASNDFDDRYSEYNVNYEIPDDSGYNHNAIFYNSSISNDTASGTLSCHTPRINPNSVNTMVSPTNSAYVYADVFGYNYTPTEFTVAWWWKVMDWGYGTGPFGLVTSNGNYMDSTLGVHDGAVYVNFAGGNTRVSRGFTGGGTGKWTHFAITFKPGSYTSYINGVSQGTATTDASLTLDPWRYLYLGAGCAGGCLRDGNIYWGDFRYYNTCLSASDIVELYKTKAYITDKGDIEAHQFIEKTENIITEAEFAIPARSTAGNGKIELRNGVMAYGLQANTYYYAGVAVSSNAIFKGKFKANTQYYFDLFMDVDTMWYAGGSRYVPGGFIVRYTDGTTVEVTTQSTDGANGWKRVQYYSNPDKSIYGLGIYYYIGTKWYLRHDSGIYEMDKDNAQVTSKYTVETTQVAETSFETNALIHSSGNVVGREIIEI